MLTLQMRYEILVRCFKTATFSEHFFAAVFVENNKDSVETH